MKSYQFVRIRFQKNRPVSPIAEKLNAAADAYRQDGQDRTARQHSTLPDPTTTPLHHSAHAASSVLSNAATPQRSWMVQPSVKPRHLDTHAGEHTEPPMFQYKKVRTEPISLTGIDLPHFTPNARPKRPITPVPRPPCKRRVPLWCRILLGLLTTILLLTGGIFIYYQIEIAPSLNNILGYQARREHKNAIAQQKNNGLTNRINIALFGSDTDEKFDIDNGSRYLAQTVMLVTIDPKTGYVGMLSLPRDMQVWDRGKGFPKLDEAFANGFKGSNLHEKIATAAGHTMDVIEENYGIHLDYYAWVGLQGFIKVIDTAGGVDVDVLHPMVDDTYPDDINNANHYDYKRLEIAPGPQHLSGTAALEYVRTRHSDLIGDIGRTIRQQQVINQLKARLTTNEVITQASAYLKDLSGFLQTDIQLSDIIHLANYARNIDSKKIERVTLGPPLYAEPITNTTNFAPRCDEIGPVIEQMFAVTPTCIPQTGMTDETQIRATRYTSQKASGRHLESLATIRPDTIAQSVRGLLGLMLLTTCESFEALSI